MEYKNTIQSLQKLGNNVVKEGRGILKKNKKGSGNLFNDFDYLVTKQQDAVTLEFEFGRAEDYWQFVDEGVRGVGVGIIMDNKDLIMNQFFHHQLN